MAHPKDGDYEVAGNNRPISLLPVLSKVLERIAHVQLVSYLTSNNLLSVHQSGNRRCYSTETLGVLFTSHLYKAIDEKNMTAVLILDLSKAFDSINHQKLLMRLCSLGIAHVQLVSYLTSNNLLSVHQSGNRRCHSTETLGVLFTSHLYKAIDEKNMTAVLILDLSKAFDSINHQKLLMRLCSLGIAHVQLVSYLTSNNLLSVHQSGNRRCHSQKLLVFSLLVICIRPSMRKI